MQKWLKATKKKDSGLVSRPFVLNWGEKMCENNEKNIWSKDNEQPQSETGWNKHWLMISLTVVTTLFKPITP